MNPELSVAQKTHKNFENLIHTFLNNDSEYAIICEDDFFPIDYFLEELNKTVELLPDDWECLHLCPGFFWGRKFRDKTKIGKLNPERNIDSIPYHESGRFFDIKDSKIYLDKEINLGGPIAMLINKRSAKSFLKRFQSEYLVTPYYEHADKIFTKMLNSKSFICREPQLGYEEESGGTTLWAN